MRDYIEAYAGRERRRRRDPRPPRCSESSPERDSRTAGGSRPARRDEGLRRRRSSRTGTCRSPPIPGLPGFTGRSLHSARTERGRHRGDACSWSAPATRAATSQWTPPRRGCARRSRSGRGPVPAEDVPGKPRGELWVMRLPPRLQDRALRLLIRSAVGRPQDYGLPRPATWSLADQKPVVNTQLLHWIHHGRIAVAPGIAGADGLAVEFAERLPRCFDRLVHRLRRRDPVPRPRAASVAGRRAAADGGVRAPRSAGPVPAPRLRRPGGAAPGPQLPVNSRQAALVARMIRVQSRSAYSLAETFTSHAAVKHRIDIIRSCSGRPRSPRPRRRGRGLAQLVDLTASGKLVGRRCGAAPTT